MSPLTYRKRILPDNRPDPDIQDAYDDALVPVDDRWITVKGDPLYAAMRQRKSYKPELLRGDATMEDVIESYNAMVRHVRFEEDVAGILDRWSDDISDSITGFEYQQEVLERQHEKHREYLDKLERRQDSVDSAELKRDMKLDGMLKEMEDIHTSIQSQLQEAVNAIELKYIQKIEDLELQLVDLAQVVSDLEDQVDGNN